jgi:pimeloyl-ACP methyl ester carboxylesterase
VPQLLRDGVVLGYEEAGAGEPALAFVHGVACNRGVWASEIEHFARRHRVVAVDLRGHGDSDAPKQPYTMRAFADDLAWMCAQLNMVRPLVVGHSLGGLIALELASSSWHASGAVLIDSVLLPEGDRGEVVRRLVAGLRGGDAERTLGDYFHGFFSSEDDPAHIDWILEQAVRTPPHVTSSVWEESLRSWDDTEALRRCQVPLAYLDAGTPNADLARALELRSDLVIGRTIGSGHFSPLEVPGQINAMLERFLELYIAT